MVSRKFGAICLATAAFGFGCDDDEEESAVVDTVVSPTADFSSFQTYAFSSAPSNGDIPQDVAINLTTINDQMRQELADVGLTEVNLDQNPDLIAFNVASTQDQESLSWGCVDGYWYGYWSMAWAPCAWLEPVYTEYTTGALVIGLADESAQQVVFGGLIVGAAEDPSDLTDDVDDDIDDVFDDYPVDD